MTQGSTLIESETNRAWAARCERAWGEMMAEALKRGFFGSVALEMRVQDGTVQGIKRRIERCEK